MRTRSSHKLSPREMQVLRLVSEGLGNKAIALALKISERTVTGYVGRILMKLGALNRTHASTMYIRDVLNSRA